MASKAKPRAKRAKVVTDYRREWKHGKNGAGVTLFRTDAGGPGWIACAWRNIGHTSEELIGHGRTPKAAVKALSRSLFGLWKWPDGAKGLYALYEKACEVVE